MDSTKTILLTGATSGIGRATTHALVKRGHRVVAAGRDQTALAELARELGVATVHLDLTDPANIRAAVAEATAHAGTTGIDVLVNNAGMGILAPIAEIEIDDVRRQFETNVFGLLALTQAVITHMRARRRGRIVNVSSVGGRLTLPLFGAYNATKHALESISDAMRYELAGLGIDVAIIEPGAIRTNFSSRAATQGGAYARSDGPFARVMSRGLELLERADARAPGPDCVASAIVAAVEARRPRARYVVPRINVLGIVLFRVLPTSLADAVFRRVYGLASKPTPSARELPAARLDGA